MATNPEEEDEVFCTLEKCLILSSVFVFCCPVTVPAFIYYAFCDFDDEGEEHGGH